MSQIVAASINKAVDKFLPDFNDELLLKRRLVTMNNSAKFFADKLEEMLDITEGRIKFVGYRTLTPQEWYNYRCGNNIPTYLRVASILKSTYKVVRYTVEFEERQYNMDVTMPFMDKQHLAVFVEGNAKHPILAICERGGMTIKDETITLAVTRARLKFERRRVTQKLTNNMVVAGYSFMCRIHQGRRRKKSTKKSFLPMLIYPFATYGVEATCEKYGFDLNKVSFKTEALTEPGYVAIKCKPKVYMHVLQDVLSSERDLSFVLTWCQIIKSGPKREVAELMNPTTYVFLLGKQVFQPESNSAMVISHALRHLEGCKTALGKLAHAQLEQLSIDAKDIYELLFVMWNNMGKFINQNIPANLSSKRIAGMDQMLTEIAQGLNSKLLAETPEKLTHEKVKRIFSNIYANWVNKSPMFRSIQHCNDNWLLAVGATRIRTIDNMDINTASKGAMSAGMVSLLSHESHLFVESVSKVSHQKPIISGHINPFLTIMEDGRIVEPDYVSKLNIYK